MHKQREEKPPPKEAGRNFEIRKGVFISGLAVFGLTAFLGIVDNRALIQVTGLLFSLILDNFRWLFQLICMLSLIVVFVICFSKVAPSDWVGRTQNQNSPLAHGLPWAVPFTNGHSRP